MSVVETTAAAVAYLHGLTPPLLHGYISPDTVVLNKRGQFQLRWYCPGESEPPVDDTVSLGHLITFLINTTVADESFATPAQRERLEMIARSCTGPPLHRPRLCRLVRQIGDVAASAASLSPTRVRVSVEWDTGIPAMDSFWADSTFATDRHVLSRIKRHIAPLEAKGVAVQIQDVSEEDVKLVETHLNSPTNALRRAFKPDGLRLRLMDVASPAACPTCHQPQVLGYLRFLRLERKPVDGEEEEDGWSYLDDLGSYRGTALYLHPPSLRLRCGGCWGADLDVDGVPWPASRLRHLQ
eukprot:CAMPEP_0175857042 /NCGR_PEP_ID=MMETSP0107_2-20121207/28872_1 /TAXON_ID=195067 ORGANISM="Goniomonas pacifica, Strain CCMP1869" /NCGR_SAMPLE_ID=MMETSP0107_2 /ASSEMBLY_ACC=CAM_ASM_000203 /LENGTH=296 /DNA_ID=CAMNT_0017173291 /DNA_START=146 /DNA_END=1033 /DNA_ORIENTATION=+